MSEFSRRWAKTFPKFWPIILTAFKIWMCFTNVRVLQKMFNLGINLSSMNKEVSDPNGSITALLTCPVIRLGGGNSFDVRLRLPAIWVEIKVAVGGVRRGAEQVQLVVIICSHQQGARLVRRCEEGVSLDA